jgi:uncharacterized sulfatase
VGDGDVRQNILLITTDQQRWDTLGVLNDKIKTPHLDNLAARGIVFNRAYTASPVCTPARVSLLTGQYLTRHGCFNIGTTLEADYPTIPGLLAQNGYFTGLVGKAHFQSWRTANNVESVQNKDNFDFFKSWSGPYYGIDKVRLSAGHSAQDISDGMHYGQWLVEQGVSRDQYFGIRKQMEFGSWKLPDDLACTKWIGDETIQMIEDVANENRPFFIWSSFMDPHAPMIVSEPWASMYDPEDMPVYSLQPGEFEDKPPFYKTMYENNSYGNDPDLQKNNSNTCSTKSGRTIEDKKKVTALYYGMISFIDHQVGRMVEKLKQHDLLDNTVIIFTSDHGDYLGNHGFWGKGMPAFDDAQKVPFLVYHPNCETPGEISQSFQSLVDIGPTCLKYAGIPQPDRIQGIDQSRSWMNANVKTRDWALVEFRPAQSKFLQRTFMKEQYKMVMYYSRDYGELYDMEADPEQRVNLWPKEEWQEIKMNLLQGLVHADMELDSHMKERTAYS